MGWQDEQEKVVKKLTASQQAFMKRRKIRTTIGDVSLMTTQEVRKHFRGEDTEAPDGAPVSTINDTQLLSTIIWQSYLKIRAKELGAMNGNLRSFWYKVIGPFYKHHNILVTDEGPALFWDSLGLSVDDFIEAIAESGRRGFEVFGRGKGGGRELYIQNRMGVCFDDFVSEGFFRFQDEFGFKDPRADFSIVGRKIPRLIFYTEKEGLWYLCREIEKEYKISVMASQGEPGLLTLEYFTDKLRARGVKNIELCAFTDYDPWGFNIAGQACAKFGKSIFGFTSVKLTHLTSLSLFRPEIIEYAKRDLTTVSAKKMTQVNKWLADGYGIPGPDGTREPYGMHIDLADMDLVRKAVKKWFKEVSG